ncbi:MAG: lipocalin family protein [Saprospiraceae bacterium]|uniref:Lipocalin family protein n=1 Tax=Candidatus Opimibacter skivensis TaxID=2982028 RepID=A0A9D7XSA3_9BACT|nr:lipocalin family protein [Candidatus Opimibacter skivensis]
MTFRKIENSLLQPLRGKYWIIEPNDDYSYTVVSHPSIKYLCRILSRTLKMNESLYKDIVNRQDEEV